MTRLIRSGALLIALAASTRPVAAQGAPKTPPPPGPLTVAPFPPFQEALLPNGVRLLVVTSRKQPVVSVSLNFSAGSSFDPAGKEGLASMAAGLLTKGAGKRSAEQMAEAIEGAGGTLNAGAGADFLSIGATVLTTSLPLAFELIGDAVARPTFPEAEVELLRTQSLSGLQVQLTQPDAIADRVFRRAVYGAHPYSRSELPSSLKAITRADLVAFHRARLRPGGALLVVAGDATLAEVRRLAIRAFQGWTGTPVPSAAFRTPPARIKSEIILVHRPGSVQSNLVVGNLTYFATDPRTYAATVANQVLGGGASSRLFMTLREQKSWTYGAYSGYTRRKGIGSFSATTEVRTEVTDSALRELLSQLKRIGAEAVPLSELDASKGAITGSYPLSIESADQVASAVANARLYGLPADYVQTYRVRIGSVTPAQAQAVAKATIRPGAAAIIVVGDGAKVYDHIKDIAPVTIVDPEGKTLTPAELAPKAVRVDFDLGALASRRDSFVVRFSGTEAGWMRGVFEKTAEGFRYTEDTRLGGGFVVQTTTLDMDPTGAMKAIKQVGKVQGQDAAIDVVYASGRAKGTASSPDPQSGKIKRLTIDTALAEGTLDDNAVQALIPAFKWKADGKWTFNVLSAGQGEIKPWTLAVSGVETVTIGAKPVEAFKAELSGPSAPLTLWVSTAKPHTLLKIAIAGQPLEFVRVP
jgi:zinc protease